MRRRNRKTKDGQLGLTREEWVAAARAVLIKEGIAAVKIDRLARDKGITRGGFYYRFDGVQDLREALLADWRATNTQPIVSVMNGPGTPPERYRAMQKAFIEEKVFNPAYDAAVREWARVSPKVAKVLHAVDDERIDAMHQLFLEAGYSEEEATARSRITYFHQVGYYAMGVRESFKRRMDLSESFYRVLTGFEIEGETVALPPTLAKKAKPTPKEKVAAETARPKRAAKKT